MHWIVTWIEECVVLKPRPNRPGGGHRHRHRPRGRRKRWWRHRQQQQPAGAAPPGKEWWDANTVRALLGFFLMCAILGMLSEGCKDITGARNPPPEWRGR